MIKKTLAALALVASLSHADRIVVNNDEWTLSNTGFASAAGTDEFAVNVANWLTAGTGDNDILILSANFGLTESSFLNTLAGAGYNVTVNSSGASTVANMADYEAIYVGGYSVNNADLINYVNNGGNVYVMAGTAQPVWDPAAEAARWNAFLNTFGLGYAPAYNNIGGTLASPGGHEILNGVSNLYFNNGNTTLDLVAGGDSQIIWSYGGQGLVGVYDGNTAAVPEPGTMALMGLGLGAVALVARRRKK